MLMRVNDAGQQSRDADSHAETFWQSTVAGFRVLHADGVLVFKWNETQVKVREVLALTPHAPLFGNTSGKKAGTHWLVFMKEGEAQC